MSDDSKRPNIPGTPDIREIPWALGDEQWNRGAFTRGSFVDGVYKMAGAQIALHTEGESTRLIIAKDGATIAFDDVTEFAALIALANEALRRVYDPRAMGHQQVELLRIAAEKINIELTLPSEDEPELRIEKLEAQSQIYSDLHELADALESYLAPEKS
jgi:hypothetical protein